MEPEIIASIMLGHVTQRGPGAERVDEQLRQTTFLGWRDDKKPEEVLLEKHDSGAPFK